MKEREARVGAELRVHAALRMGHESHHVAGRVRDARNVAPLVKAEVNTVSVRTTTRSTGFDTKESPALRISAPGSRCASHRIWNPLQTPTTAPPDLACSDTACITGLNRAMAPERR